MKNPERLDDRHAVFRLIQPQVTETELSPHIKHPFREVVLPFLFASTVILLAIVYLDHEEAIHKFISSPVSMQTTVDPVTHEIGQAVNNALAAIKVIH